MNDEDIIMKNIIQTKMELEIANENFENAEEEMIDYYTYQIKANKAKIDYLIKRMKKDGKKMNMIKQIELMKTINQAM